MLQKTAVQNMTRDVQRLEDVLEVLDQFHSQVSGDGLVFRSLDERQQLVTLLQEVAYTVNETVHELERVTPVADFQFRIGEKPSA